MFMDCRMIIFVAGICAIIWIRSLVLARDDAVGALIAFSGCLLVFYLSLCTVIEIRSLVLARDDGVGSTVLLLCGCIPYSSVHQECGACTANILHDGQVDVKAEACLCTHRQMNIICILMFFCSYV